MVNVKEVSALWALACADAEYEQNTQTALYLVGGEAGNGPAALHVEPEFEVCADPDWALGPKQIADANSSTRRGAHRILVREFQSARVALGRLRHELEHARQYDRCPDLYRGMGLPQDALSRAVEERRPPSMEGSACLYNLLPSEEDANRAAAQLATAHFGPPSEADLATTNAPLFRDASPVHPDTLARRLLATSALFPDAFAWVAEQRETPVDALLERQLGPDAPAAWRSLLDQPEIAQHGIAALDHCPSEATIQSASRPPAAWAEVMARIKQGREMAEAHLQTAFPALELY
jgi:hypothetical protein